ncbi:MULTISPECIES: lycopene beta-cyclase CrtY [Sphingomonas]|uniref:Lycopene beta-cyclase CrtY n=1 Tax=Sphingomonas lycopersici TaxID=2951807 RepID=A0AA41Z8W2_9SPHN|nr:MULTISPECIES: lycopene beta-cyclase CrtY [Sphingomonas]MCW6534942.1 lycopene beta-cyclase CrtY [Sphingomonas lycopersici]OJU16967.1 MAG: lycopene cyclase [Sphingomonas sp. 66-10]
MAATHGCDIAIVGGGLSGSLIALALAAKRPDLSLRLIEAGETIGGDRLWSFLDADVARADRWLLTSLIVHAWPVYDVAFPGQARALRHPCYAITGERLDLVVRAQLSPDAVMTGRKVLGCSPHSVTLAGGERIEAKGVIDARGAGDLSALDIGWRKFLARELEIAGGHGLDQPILADATVTQHDGYRFVRCLPLSPTRVLVEDNYCSDNAALNAGALNRRIEVYAESRGWQASEAGREERGTLPLAIGGDFDALWRAGGARVAKAGTRAGLFHPSTGRSLPDAVRLAVLIADTPDLSGDSLYALTLDYARARWAERRFYRLFNALMFRAAGSEARYRVAAWLYRQPAGLISRFHAARCTFSDRARMLRGKPPVPFWRAVKLARRIE